MTTARCDSAAARHHLSTSAMSRKAQTPGRSQARNRRRQRLRAGGDQQPVIRSTQAARRGHRPVAAVDLRRRHRRRSA